MDHDGLWKQYFLIFLMEIVYGFFPWIADIVVKRKVRGLFKDEMEARKRQRIEVVGTLRVP